MLGSDIVRAKLLDATGRMLDALPRATGDVASRYRGHPIGADALRAVRPGHVGVDELSAERLNRAIDGTTSSAPSVSAPARGPTSSGLVGGADAPQIIADDIEEMHRNGVRARWWNLSIGQKDRKFGTWMCAPYKKPLPPVDEDSSFYCGEIFLYAAAKRGLLDLDSIHKLTIWADKSVPEDVMMRKLRDAYLPHEQQLYIPGDRSGPQPQRGDLLVWGNVEHVAMETGVPDEVFSFWPHYEDPARYPPERSVTYGYDRAWLGWKMPVQRVSVDELNTYWTEEQKLPVPPILKGRGPW